MVQHQFHPHHLFSDSSSSLPSVPTHSGVFLTGPLSVSSLLHIALHHLSSPLHPDPPKRRELELSERAKGKQPERARHVLILSPDRAAWRTALVEENDLALGGKDTDGKAMQRLEKVEIKYLPATAHFTYFLTTLYTHDSPISAYDAYIASGAKAKADPSYLPLVPTLVILHNPSDYLAEDTNQRGGIEAYASLLALFISTFSALPGPPLLVLHDRNASSLQLPVLPPHLHKPSRRHRDAEDDDDEMGGDEVQRAGLAKAAEHFFDLCGVVEQVPTSPSSVTVDEEKLLRLTLRRSGRWLSRAGRVDVVVDYAVRTEEDDDGTVGRRIELRL